MDYKYLKQTASLELRDNRSGHVWGYEIDNLNPEVKISKNGEHLRTVLSVNIPISLTWLEEIREGL